MNNIILYSTNCPKCKILETKLNLKKIAYSVITDVELMIEKGFEQAPVLEINGKFMDFKSANDWVEEQ